MICPSVQPNGAYFRVSRANSTIERPTPYSTGARKAGCSDYLLGQVFGILGYATRAGQESTDRMGSDAALVHRVAEAVEYADLHLANVRREADGPDDTGYTSGQSVDNQGQAMINRRKCIALTVYFAPRRVT
jgi:hypothetical protein